MSVSRLLPRRGEASKAGTHFSSPAPIQRVCRITKECRICVSARFPRDGVHRDIPSRIDLLRRPTFRQASTTPAKDGSTRDSLWSVPFDPDHVGRSFFQRPPFRIHDAQVRQSRSRLDEVCVAHDRVRASPRVVGFDQSVDRRSRRIGLVVLSCGAHQERWCFRSLLYGARLPAFAC